MKRKNMEGKAQCFTLYRKNTPVYWVKNHPINQECIRVYRKRLVGLNADPVVVKVWKTGVLLKNYQLLRSLTEAEACLQ